MTGFRQPNHAPHLEFELILLCRFGSGGSSFGSYVLQYNSVMLQTSDIPATMMAAATKKPPVYDDIPAL